MLIFASFGSKRKEMFGRLTAPIGRDTGGDNKGERGRGEGEGKCDRPAIDGAGVGVGRNI